MKLTTAQDLLDVDSRLRVVTAGATPHPQQICWIAMHQDYYEGLALDDPLSSAQTEQWYGDKIVKRCSHKGHHGVLEHPQIILNVGGFPHDVMQQLRTHRVGVSFDVQSGRYTAKRFLDDSLDIEDVYWLRPPGFYRDRDDTPVYEYTEQDRNSDINFLEICRNHYREAITVRGLAPEHARQMAPFGFRQNFVLSGNLRAMLHLLMLRGKADVQLETQAFSILLEEQLSQWCPEILAWWENKGKKLKLTP